MKVKLLGVICKLKNITIILSNAYVFYNMYLTKKVYFGCRIIKLLPQQEEMLIKIYEPVLLVKLGLSKKFLRRMLYARILALGVGIMKLSIIIAILAIKLYLDYIRSKDRIAQIIEINKENA